ncbi:hypothetical protein C7R93_20575 [Brevibacillus fortis]|uniref:Uncharacterized protein n=1 Tax=Brevibacillus fortis TaxID=2126352 RepID=A0A2P7UYX5_9BACL|nr:hypothetical protein C7R93_20575 [Brevibacillus fortis]
MQKAKHAFKRPPLKHILNGPLWTRFRFLHGVVQSIPQRVALEAERFLLFPPHHNSQTKFFYFSRSLTTSIEKTETQLYNSIKRKCLLIFVYCKGLHLPVFSYF